MKLILKLFTIFVLIFSFSQSNAWTFDDTINNWSTKVHITCSGKDCNIKTWVEEVKNTVNWIETDRPLSQYIQDVVARILTYISIIAVLYIIYAWFRILFWAWDEEVLKKQKTTILYVIIWMAVIWLAYSITIFVISIFNS